MTEQPGAGLRAKWRSIRTRLTSVFALFLVLVVMVSLSALQELGAVNKVSAEIRDRWLQDTRLLGDLNNYTSDARAAEASRLLAMTIAQSKRVDVQAEAIRAAIELAERGYSRQPHDAEERSLYAVFLQDWSTYSSAARDVVSLADRGDLDSATSLYLSRSETAYDAASDALGVLTSRTVEKASAVSGRAMATYAVACGLILVTMAAAAAVVLAAVTYITKQITRPILTLAAAMRSLAANDMNVIIVGSGRADELGEMARAVEVFHANAVELRESQQGLIHQASMLEERLQAEEALSAMHRNIASMTSHEFRTPLTVIDGHAQRLISTAGRATPAHIVERATRIRVVVRQLTQLISHLMSSARLQERHASLYFHPHPVNFSELIVAVIQLHRDISPHIRISENIFPGLMVEADPELLHQAVSNLLSNAIKYSPQNTGIEIEARLESPFAVLEVHDYGIGIPETDLPTIFERYGRASNVGGIVGAGLGLHLVKIVLDLHNGSISVASQEERGSSFSVRLALIDPDKLQ